MSTQNNQVKQVNRLDLMSVHAKKEENNQFLMKEVFEDEKTLISRKIREIEDKIQDAESALTKRMRASEMIDDSVIFVTFAGIEELKSKLRTIKSFERTYYTK